MAATLKLDIIQNASSATANLTLDTNGNATVGNTLAMGSSFLRNRIINGDFSIAQRATTYALTSGVVYGSVDRWAFFQSGTANGIANQVSSGLTGFQYALKLGRNNTATQTGVIGALQAIETVNSIVFAGQSVTLSFYAKAGTNFSASGSNISVYVYSGTGTDQSAFTWVASGWTGGAYPVSTSQAITSSWVKYTFTGTVSSSATQLGVQFQYTPVGTAGADDNLYITGVQLEVGSVATPFERRQYGQELALCQRYYWKIQSTGSATFFGSSYNDTTTAAQGLIPFPVTMRVPPTALEQSGTAGDYRVSAAGGTVNCSSVPIFSAADISYARTTFTVASGLTAGQASQFRSVNSNAYLGWSAEL